MNKQLTISEVQQALCPYIKSECLWCYSYPGRDGTKLWDKPKPSSSSTIISNLGRPDWIKPVLIKLEDTTDKDAIDIAKIFHPDVEQKHKPEYGKVRLKELNITMINCYTSWRLYQHLIKKGYAVPLWFDIDHWANGMTAIELGIAFDKTKII